MIVGPRWGPRGMGNRAETEDEALGFEAAVAALGLKANVSEADHPLLCEGTRRQRGELTLTLLVQYKDCSEKLARIMDKLLDRFSVCLLDLRWSLSILILYREVHQLMKAPLLPSYYSSNPPTTAQSLHRSQANRTSGQPCRVPWVRTMAGVRAEEAAAEQSQQGFMQQAQEIADAQGAQMSQYLI
jgi:hypothetical protein